MPKAIKTLEAIEQALQSDQGAKFRGLLRRIMPLMDDAYNEEENDFRAHLGASVIGNKCERAVWYNFRWVTLTRRKGQLLRLFNRGHLEEARMIAALLMIGCNVHIRDTNGNQFRIPGYGGHYGGSLDGVVEGCPDIPNYPILGEFKTHNEKSFTKLVDEGLLRSKWAHFVQMQQYMGEMVLQFGLYLAVNKNTDELYGELIAFDPNNYRQFKQRAVTVIHAKTPAKRISESPAWFECKFCDHADVCHRKALPHRSCRTCVHSAPAPDGVWVCTEETRNAQYGDNIPLNEADQLKACELYQMIPEIKSK